MLPDSTSSVIEDHDVSSSSYNSDENPDSDALDNLLNTVCIYLVLTVLAVLCVNSHCIVLLYLHIYNVMYIIIFYAHMDQKQLTNRGWRQMQEANLHLIELWLTNQILMKGHASIVHKTGSFMCSSDERKVPSEQCV